MHFRISAWLAVAFALALSTACVLPGYNSYDGGPQGCSGVCSTDGGSDGGLLSDGGDIFAVVTTITALRQVQPLGVHAQLQQVVVTGLAIEQRCGEDSLQEAPFWVVDPAKPSTGLWIDPGCRGIGTHLAIGDVVTVDGYLQIEPSTDDVIGYRLALSNATQDAGPLSVGMDASQQSPPPDNEVGAGFGDAGASATAANPELTGARIHIPGPLWLTDDTPPALAQYSLGQVRGYAGFELSGGILVSEALLPRRSDGGIGCAWDDWARDGGGVVFATGVRGIWDTYTHAPCIDGGINGDGGVVCAAGGIAQGFVPGTDASYTLVLYPQDCLNDLPGTVDAGGP